MGILDIPSYSRKDADTKFAPYPSTFDVIVVGATEVGVMSAIAAARQGCSVLLVGQNERIGGNIGYGITKQDNVTSMSPEMVRGIAREFFSRCARLNTRDIDFYRWYRIGGPTKPSWTKQVYGEMLAAEKNITVLLSQTLDSVTKSGTKITSLTISGRKYSGTVIVDATPTGDVPQKAGCTVSIGREGNAAYGETNAGITALSATGIDPYVTPGNPASGVLPGISTRSLGAVDSADPGVMTFGWRLFVTTEASEKLPWPTTQPEGYNAQNYELLARQWGGNQDFYNATDGSYPDVQLQALARSFQLYPLGGENVLTTWPKYSDLNSRGYLSSTYPNAEECLEYVTATPARRAEIETKARQYLKGLFYFITQSGDARVPANLKTAINTIGLSNLDLIEYGGWNPNFYVREGARIVGDYVMKSSNLDVPDGNGTPVDPIAWFCYDIDAHPVRMLVDGTTAKTEGSLGITLGVSQYGAPVSMKVLFPKVTECTNLLCPGQPSVSRYVYTGLRATTTMVVIGEGAGYVAADAVRYKLDVQNVNAARVKAMQNLSGLTGAVCGAGPTTAYRMQVTVSEGGTGAAFADVGSQERWGQHLAVPTMVQSVDAGVDRYKRYVPYLNRAGQYRVVHIFPPTQSSDIATVKRASNVQITIVHGDGTSIRVENQQYPGPGGGFDVLGDFYFPYNISNGIAGGGGYIDINTSGATTDGIVIAGIVALFPVDDAEKSLNV